MPVLTVNPGTYISESLPNAVTTDADTGSIATADDRTDAVQEKRWHDMIDRYLIEWGRDPNQLEDDGLEAPSIRTIQLAVHVGRGFCAAGLPAPTRIVPDTHGGIVFERRENEILESFRISADFRGDLCFFKNSKMVRRESFDLHGIVD